MEILGQECWFMWWAHFSDKESNIYFWNEKFYNWVFLEKKSTCGFKEAFIVIHLNFFLNGSKMTRFFGEIKKNNLSDGWEVEIVGVAL